MKQDFTAKQRRRKYEMSYFLRNCRKASVTEKDINRQLRQIRYLESYYETAELLKEVIHDGIGLIKIRDLLQKSYDILNTAAFKTLDETELDQISLVASLDLTRPGLLSERCDIFTIRKLKKLIHTSSRLLELTDKNIIHEIRFRDEEEGQT